MHEFNLANVKTFLGRQGHGLNAVIVMDGKPVADVLDEANGGAMRVTWFAGKGPERGQGNEAARSALLQHVRDEHERQSGDAAHEARCKERGIWFEGCGLSGRGDQDVIEHWINEEFARMETLRNLKRWSKTKTVFRLRSDKDGEYRTLTKPYTPEVVAFLREKFGDQLAFVFNPASPSLEGIG